MNITNIRSNNQAIMLCAVLMCCIQIANFLVTRLKGVDLPMGNAVMGFTIYGGLAWFFRRNHLLRQWQANPWLLPYCGYIALSFCYGIVRYKTMTSSVFDLWLFAFIPAMTLIRPFSFDARVLDRIVACGTIAGSLGLILVLLRIPEARYVRETYQFYAGPLATLAAGAGYLLLKHSMGFNFYTAIGLAGVLTNAVGAGVVAAFRGQLLLSGILLILFVLIQLRTIRKGFGWKLLSMVCLCIAIGVGVFLASGSFKEQAYAMLERFSGITEAYAKTGEVTQSDARLGEMYYFMQLNSNWKLILGHGVGALWYDFHGMFGEGKGGGFAGARTMLHLNWLHVTFKIGVVGFFLLIGLLVHHWRKHREFIRQNYGWWAFLMWYCAFTTYYGDKSLSIASVIYLTVLIHPWVFKVDVLRRQSSHGEPVYRGRR